MSYYHHTSNTTVSVTQPLTSSECRIILTQNEKERDMIYTSIADVEKQILALHNQLDRLNISASALNAELKQNEINKIYLTECLTTLETREKANTYFTSCKEFINTYEWVNPDDDRNVGNDEKKKLPHDVFSYLSLPFRPLETFTTDEIIKIAHYLKACELLADEEDIPDGYTYAQALNICKYYNGEYILPNRSELHYDYLSDRVRLFADVLLQFDEVSLTTKYITVEHIRID